MTQFTHPNAPGYNRSIKFSARDFVPKTNSFNKSGQSTGHSGHNKSYARFQDRGDYRHGGSHTLRQAWHSGNRPFGRRNKRRGRDRETLDISRFIKKAVGRSEQKIEITNTFVDFGLNEYILRNLLDKKYDTPSPIQDRAIPHIMAGKDLVGLANTGTGKTAAFLLPLIHKISLNPANESVLIVAPTRELAQQIDTEFRLFAKGMNMFSVVCVGGVPAYAQIQMLRRNPHVIIGTPGRIQDLAAKGFINFNMFKNVVIDEVDHMLDMGFIEPITEILNSLPKDRQSLFFSATMPDKIRQLVHMFLNNPVTVEIQSGKTTDNVDQNIVRVNHPSEKLQVLVDILKQPEMQKVLVFSETKRDVERLTQDLIAQGLKVSSIHGDKDQIERTRALNFFKSGMINILVATDVAARGIDVNDITHVINYTIPQTHDDYVHRIGRTGRGNKTGIALTFV